MRVSEETTGYSQNARQGIQATNSQNASSVQGSIPQPHIQPSQLHQGRDHEHPPNHGHLPQAQFPPQLQHAFAQFYAVNQQLAAQLATIGNNPMLQSVAANHVQMQPFQQPAFSQPSFQHFIAQQQQARAAAGHQGLNDPAVHNMHGNAQVASAVHEAPITRSVAQEPPPVPSPLPANTNTIVRENNGPHGERWQMVIQSGPLNVNPFNGTHTPNTTPSNSTHGRPYSPRQASPMSLAGQASRNLGAGTAGSRAPSPLRLSSTQSPATNAGIMNFQSNLSMIEAAMANGNPLPEYVFEQAREMLRAIPGLSQEQESWLRTRLDTHSSRANYLREQLHQHLIRASQERVSSQRIAQGANSTAVYVLSSPSGPHALLVSPTGLYTTPWQFPTAGAFAPYSMMHVIPQAVQPASFTHAANGNHPQADPTPVAQAQQQAPQQAPQQINAAHVAQAPQEQQQQANQARDLVRILLPLGGHLWLFIRLFGFVYFFTAGAGWRRTILLGLAAGLVFIAQTGIFRPVMRGLWDPIRRHAEGLVPLAGNERQRVGPPRAGENADAARAQRINRSPTPEEAGQGNVQESEQHNQSLVRRTFRRAERAIALFVASLVPGVGERHIAAREAAASARQAEVREREERVRAEEEERVRQQQEGKANSGSADTEGNASNAGNSAVAPDQEQVSQPPLVEV